MKKEQLITVADELNEVLGLEPEIDTSKKGSEIEAKIKEAAEMLEPEDEDALSEEVILLLQKMDIWINKEEKEEENAEEEEENAEEQEEEEEVEEKEEEEEVEEKEAPKPKTKAKGKAKKEEKPKKEKPKPDGKRGKGVIATIADTIEKSGKKGVSKAEILEVLVKTFPDRQKDSMQRTINVQIPGRMSKEKFPIVEKNGKYLKG